MSLQTIFDTVSIGMLKQNEQSMDGSKCVYRNCRGLKCAAGMIIPDELYNPKWDEETITFESLEYSLHKALNLSQKDIDFVCELQSIHDDRDVPFWKAELILLAQLFKLDYTLIKDFK